MSRPYGRRPPYRRRDRLGFGCTLLLGVFGIILGAAVYLSIPAHSTPVLYPVDVCGSLRQHVPLVSIERELRGWGFSEAGAGWYVGVQIRTLCPELMDSVRSTLA